MYCVRLHHVCIMFSVYQVLLVIFFFFFKQKTAYEMRISDWSSDVCSSDLTAGPFCTKCGALTGTSRASPGIRRTASPLARKPPSHCRLRCPPRWQHSLWCAGTSVSSPGGKTVIVFRSEEHPSELQSLVRISYAVFCSKKTIHINTQLTYQTNAT